MPRPALPGFSHPAGLCVAPGVELIGVAGPYTLRVVVVPTTPGHESCNLTASHCEVAKYALLPVPNNGFLLSFAGGDTGRGKY
jgi:hypothetical protein